MRFESAIAVFDKVLSAGLASAIAIAIARALGVDDLGDFALYTAVAIIISTFANFGTHSVSGRAIAKNPDLLPRYLGNALGIRLFISAPATIILTGISPMVLGRGADQMCTAVLCAANVQALSVILLMCNALFSLRRVPSALAVNITQKFVALAVALPLAFLYHAIYVTIMGLIASACAAAALGFVIFRRRYPGFRIRIQGRFAGPFIRRSMPLASAAVAENVGLRIDVILIGFLLGSATAGVYSAAYTIYIAATMVPLALIKVFFVRYAAVIDKAPAAAHEIMTRTRRRLLFISLSSLAIICSTAPWVVPTLFGSAFSASIPPLAMLSLALPFIALNRFYGHMLVAHGADQAYLVSAILGAAFNVSANIAFIPWYGPLGAGIAAVISESATCLYSWHAYRQYNSRT